MQIINELKLDFKDVLIRPKRSETASRSKVELERTYKMLNSKQEWTGVPIIASNMIATGTMAMSKSISKHGMLTCLHKHYQENELVDFFNTEQNYHAFYTMGIRDGDIERLNKVKETSDIKNICVDVANGYTNYFQDKVKQVREVCPNATIMAGNVVTPEMVQELLLSGAADIVKIGIGPGSVCTTRVKTGVGYPQLSAVIECADAAHGLGGLICSDGGCTVPGDVVKAFSGGADFVMLGGMLAGTDESEGEWEEEALLTKSDMGTKVESDEEGNVIWVKKCLKFYGMSSEEAMAKYNGGMAEYRAAEGKCVKLPYKGPVDLVVKDILGGIRSACAYVGANRLKDLSKCTTFIRTTVQENQVFS